MNLHMTFKFFQIQIHSNFNDFEMINFTCFPINILAENKTKLGNLFCHDLEIWVMVDVP